MAYREVDLESFLLGRVAKRETQEDGAATDLHSRGQSDEQNSVAGRMVDDEEDEPKLHSKPKLHLHVERNLDLESGGRASTDGQLPSVLAKQNDVWDWVWGGSHYSGSACMAISSASYSFMGLFIKLLSERSVPSFQIVVFRCGFVSLVAGASLRRMKHPLLGLPGVRHLVFARAVTGFIAISAYFYSIQVLPLRDATVLSFTSPVFIVIMAALYLKESWTSAQAAGTFCSFVGVLLVTQPQIFSGGNEAWFKGVGDLFYEVAVALGGAAVGALSYIVVRMIGQRGEPPLVPVFAFAAFSTPMAALGMLFQGFKFPNLFELTLLFLVSISGYCAQIFLTRALQLDKASAVAPLQYLKVLFTVILGAMFLHEIPTFKNVLGAILITGSATSMSYRGVA